MSNTAASLRRKIVSAGELESVVRMMKAMAASSIGQYEDAVRSLDDYYRTVQLGLVTCFRQSERAQTGPQEAGAIVFGSDQGLVGQFNDVIAEFVVDALEKLQGKKTVWAVGERIRLRLADTDMQQGEQFILPNSTSAITPLVGQILLMIKKYREQNGIRQIFIFHHRPHSGAIHTPVWP